MVETKSRWKSVAGREKWAARGASLVAKTKAYQGGVVPAQARGDRQEDWLDGQGDQAGDQEGDPCRQVGTRCHQEDDQQH